MSYSAPVRIGCKGIEEPCPSVLEVTRIARLCGLPSSFVVVVVAGVVLVLVVLVVVVVVEDEDGGGDGGNGNDARVGSKVLVGR